MRREVELAIQGLAYARELVVIEPQDQAVGRAIRADDRRVLAARENGEARPSGLKLRGRDRRDRLRPEQRGEWGKRAQASRRPRVSRLLLGASRLTLEARIRIAGPSEVDDAPLLLGGQAGATASLRIDGFHGDLVILLPDSTGRYGHVGTDAHHGRHRLGDHARVGILQPDDLLLDVASPREKVRLLPLHLRGRRLDRGVGRLLLDVGDALADLEITSGAQNLRVRPPLLVLDEAVGRAHAQELALTHAHEAARVEDGLEHVAHRRAEEIEGHRARHVVRDHHVDLVVLREEPEGALGAGIAQAQVDGVDGQPVVAGAWPRGRWSESLSSRLSGQKGRQDEHGGEDQGRLRPRTHGSTYLLGPPGAGGAGVGGAGAEGAGAPPAGGGGVDGGGPDGPPASAGLPAAGGCF